jgi:hypothetical protein
MNNLYATAFIYLIVLPLTIYGFISTVTISAHSAAKKFLTGTSVISGAYYTLLFKLPYQYIIHPFSNFLKFRLLYIPNNKEYTLKNK